MRKRGKLAYIREILGVYPEIQAKPPEDRTESEQRRIEIVERILNTVDQMPDACGKRRMIKLTYFDKTHKLYGAASAIFISERTAQRWNAQIMRIAEEIMDLA